MDNQRRSLEFMVQLTIGMAPYEALYGKKYQTPV